jgi:hypothetical protein
MSRAGYVADRWHFCGVCACVFAKRTVKGVVIVRGFEECRDVIKQLRQVP